MSLRIRLSKIGKKNNPAYRVVVAEKRSHQSGRIIDFIGFFDPRNQGKNVIDEKKVAYWKKSGAKLSESVEKMINKSYRFKKYQPSTKTSK